MAAVEEDSTKISAKQKSDYYLVDSHCHLHDRGAYNYAFSHQQIGKKLLRKYPDLPHEPTDFTPEKLISRAHGADVKKMICVGTSPEDSMVARDFATKYQQDGLFWSYGIHPDEAMMDTKIDLSSLDGGPVAIGEVGLDYRDGESNRKNQLRLLEQMVQLAVDRDLPLIFHVREAFSDFFAVVDNFPTARGVVHSFSDSPENLKKALNHNFYIGVNGLVTFAPEIPVLAIPFDKLLLETDAPFLTPNPFRGTINESAHIKDICAYISKINGVTEAEIAKVTTENAERLFKI